MQDDPYRRVIEPADGPRLLVAQDGGRLRLQVGLLAVALTPAEARSLGVALVLASTYAREASE